MNNLLDAVKGFQDEPNDSSDDETNVDQHDLEKGSSSKSRANAGKQQQLEQQKQAMKIDYMGHFYREMDAIKENIDQVGVATRAIRELQELALSATTAQEEDDLSRKLQPILELTNQKAKRTKTLLGLLKEETDRLKEEQNTLNESDIRVRQNLCSTITRKFVDEMKVYQQTQQEYKNALKQKAKRQIIAIKPDATDEQVEQVMKSQGGREALMKQVVLSNTVNSEIQTTFDKVAGKYQDVMKLEQSVAELHQLFLDFALITEQQGELLDSIEYSVQAANEHVECANEETAKAIEYQSAIRKKQCWIIAIASGAVLILVFIIAR